MSKTGLAILGCLFLLGACGQAQGQLTRATAQALITKRVAEEERGEHPVPGQLRYTLGRLLTKEALAQNIIELKEWKWSMGLEPIPIVAYILTEGWRSIFTPVEGPSLMRFGKGKPNQMCAVAAQCPPGTVGSFDVQSGYSRVPKELGLRERLEWAYSNGIPNLSVQLRTIRRVITVTGITGSADSTTVEFEETVEPGLPERVSQCRCFEEGNTKGRPEDDGPAVVFTPVSLTGPIVIKRMATLRLYDDGWRVEGVWSYPGQ